MRKAKCAILSFAALILTGCGGLTDEAKQIIGDYYINEISPETPMMELKSNGSCVVRAIKPGVISYSVPGKWNVKNDSLLIDLDPSGLKFEGDSTMIGNISKHIGRRIVSFNDYSLTVNIDGSPYVYQRRGHVDKDAFETQEFSQDEQSQDEE